MTNNDYTTTNVRGVKEGTTPEEERDWKSIQKEWESGESSMKQLSVKYGIPYNTIRKRRERHEWNPPDKVNVKKRTKLQQAEDRAEKLAEAAEHKRLKKEQELIKQKNEEVAYSGGVGLSDEERLFAQEFLLCHSPTNAYRKAFGRNPKDKNEPYRILRYKRIQRYITELQAGVGESFALTLQNLMQEFTEMAFSDINDWIEWGSQDITQKKVIGYDENGNPEYELDDDGFPVTEVVGQRPFIKFKNEDERPVNSRVIQEIKMGKDGISVKMVDKLAAMRELKEFFKYVQTDEMRRLQEEKLRVEIALLKAGNQLDGKSGGTVIINNKDEMRRIMQERMKQKQIIDVEAVES